jgi:hypothetical protein
MIAPPLPPDEARRLQALRSLCLLDSPAEERFDRIVRTAVLQLLLNGFTGAPHSYPRAVPGKGPTV